MNNLRKNASRIFFIIACLLLIISVLFSALSFAKYISAQKTELGGVNVAPISCSFEVDGIAGGSGSFINSPFMQKLSENTQAVRKNSFAESKITVKNNGVTGRAYNYSFIVYMPVDFAKNVMFQLVKLDSSDKAELASEIYQITEDENGASFTIGYATLKETDTVPNDYKSLLDEGKTLEISSHAEILDGGERQGILKSTFPTYITETAGEDEGQSQFDRLSCSVTVSKIVNFTYLRLTVNLPVNSDDFVLTEDGADHSYLFRCAPRDAFPADSFESNVWNADDYKDTTPEVPQGYSCRWSGEKLDELEIAESDGVFHAVKIGACTGITSPSTVNVTFTQVQTG